MYTERWIQHDFVTYWSSFFSLERLPILLSEYVLTYIHCLLTPSVIVMTIFDMFRYAYRANL